MNSGAVVQRIGSGDKNAGGAVSIVAGATTQTGTSGLGGLVYLSAGNSAVTGGDVTVASGTGSGDSRRA